MQDKKETSPQPVIHIHSDLLFVDDLKVIRFLLDVKQHRSLLPFAKAPTSVSQAASALEIDFRSAYRLVKRLEEYGLICVSNLEPRNGRPISYYRTSAKTFFMPKASTPIEEALRLMSNDLEQSFVGAIMGCIWNALGADSGIQFSLSEDGSGHCVLATRPHVMLDATSTEFPAVTNLWNRLMLEFEDAKALQGELLKLVQKYGAKNRQGAQAYMLRLAMTPMQGG